jgi:hypothetical protein
VQRWISDGAANHGIVLTNEGAGQVLRIYSSENGNAAQRPTLSVTYL